MRIAISGSHRTGKSTLIEELCSLLPEYTAVDEPYHSLEEEGHDFSHPPSIEDFEAQLERSLEDLEDGGDHVLFDRCPLDFLAYLATHEDAGFFDADGWLPRLRDAIETLDLIVFVPIEDRDRIRFSAWDDDGVIRSVVDEELRRLLLDDPFELELTVLEVRGSPEARARSVLGCMRS